MSEYAFFDISFQAFNLFSFMMGMIFSFFNQGLFGKRMGKYIIFYLLSLALVYGMRYYHEKETNSTPNAPTLFIEVPK